MDASFKADFGGKAGERFEELDNLEVEECLEVSSPNWYRILEGLYHQIWIGCKSLNIFWGMISVYLILI